MTGFKYYNGSVAKKLYLSAILDLYDRRIVAYKISEHNNDELVFSNFDEAVALNPNAHPLFHSDRGFQYTTKTFHQKLMGGRVCPECVDVLTTGQWKVTGGIIKSEMYYLKKFTSKENLTDAIEAYIVCYNTQRCQIRLNCMTPIEYHEAYGVDLSGNFAAVSLLISKNTAVCTICTDCFRKIVQRFCLNLGELDKQIAGCARFFHLAQWSINYKKNNNFLKKIVDISKKNCYNNYRLQRWTTKIMRHFREWLCDWESYKMLQDISHTNYFKEEAIRTSKRSEKIYGKVDMLLTYRKVLLWKKRLFL